MSRIGYLTPTRGYTGQWFKRNSRHHNKALQRIRSILLVPRSLSQAAELYRYVEIVEELTLSVESITSTAMFQCFR
jgi:hypothetical protein